MQRKLPCPECGIDTRMIGLAIEPDEWPHDSDIVETYSYLCPACNKSWDVRITQASRIHISQSLAAIHQ